LGSGKSSIVRTLKELLEGKNINEKKIRFIHYNAWKYSNDSFRKTFLLNSIEEKKLKKKYEKILYENVTTTDYTIDKKFNCKLFSVVIAVVLIFAIMYFFFEPDEEFVNTVTKAILTLVGFFAIQEVAKLVIKKMFVEKKITREKMFSPHDFSMYFSKISSKNQTFSIYVVDDLDRCNPTQTIEILETINGYLKSDNDNHIFLIPIDKERLYKILKVEKKYSLIDCNEYFSKLFDVSIDIKLPGKTNMYDMLKKISLDNNYGISNLSLSILSDCLITTPRDAKKHLNNIYLKIDIIQRQKKAGFINRGSFENGWDEIVKLYIIENKWPDIYDFMRNSYLTMNLNSEATYLNNSIFENIEEFFYFRTLTQSILITSINAYDMLKINEVHTDTDIINYILNGDTQLAYEKCISDKKSFVENLEYIYKTYIIQRNLLKQYFSYILKSYFYFLTQVENKYEILNCSISIQELLLNYNRLMKINNKKENLEVLNIFDTTIIDYLINGKDTKMYSEIILEFIRCLINCNQNNSLYKILTEYGNLEYINSVVDESINHLIANDQENDLHKIFNHVSYDVVKNQKEVWEIFDTALEFKQYHTILVLLEQYHEILIPKYNDDILAILTILPLFSSRRGQWNEERKSQQLLELNIIEILITNNTETIEHVEDISVDYVEHVINRLNSISTMPDILSKIIDIYLRLDVLNSNHDFLFEIITFLNLEENTNEIKRILSLDFPAALINEMYIIRMNLSPFSELNTEYVNFLNRTDGENNLILLKQIIEALAANNSTISINLTEISTATIHFDLKSSTNEFLPHIIHLNRKIFTELIELLSFKIISGTKEIWEYITSLKKSDTILKTIVTKITTLEEYNLCLPIIAKSSHKAGYHASMERILENIVNVDQLLEIHDLENNFIDSTDLNKIKRVVEDRFPQQKELFTKISWKK